jgi:hypothetical protein
VAEAYGHTRHVELSLKGVDSTVKESGIESKYENGHKKIHFLLYADYNKTRYIISL